MYCKTVKFSFEVQFLPAKRPSPTFVGDFQTQRLLNPLSFTHPALISFKVLCCSSVPKNGTHNNNLFMKSAYGIKTNIWSYFARLLCSRYLAKSVINEQQGGESCKHHTLRVHKSKPRSIRNIILQGFMLIQRHVRRETFVDT